MVKVTPMGTFCDPYHPFSKLRQIAMGNSPHPIRTPTLSPFMIFYKSKKFLWEVATKITTLKSMNFQKEMKFQPKNTHSFLLCFRQYNTHFSMKSAGVAYLYTM